MINLVKLFKTKHPIIGMVHLKPLVGYEGFTSVENITKAALQDAATLEEAGCHAIIVENNYDVPHKIYIDESVEKVFLQVTKAVKAKTALPLGISVLWNDHKAALRIAKEVGAIFIRIPAFVDSVDTNYGRADAVADEALKYRNEIDADGIKLLTDIQVKHSELINKRPIQESALEAVEKGSDGLIITGNWTGDAPNTDDLEAVRKAVGNFPIFIGSGADDNNVNELLKHADSIIVGTSIKTGKSGTKEENVNLRSYDERIDLKKAKEFVKKATEHTE